MVSDSHDGFHHLFISDGSPSQGQRAHIPNDQVGCSDVWHRMFPFFCALWIESMMQIREVQISIIQRKVSTNKHIYIYDDICTIQIHMIFMQYFFL